MEIESVQTILCLLYNIARREQNRPAFYSADATMCVLVPYTLCSSSRIGLYAKCVLSFLQLLMYDDELRCLELTAEDLTFFVNALSTLLTSEEATASGFSLEEILVILNNMASVDKNLLAFQTKPEIFTALDEIVLSAVEFVRKQSICLLLSLIQSQETVDILSQTTIWTLKTLEEDSSSSAAARSQIHCLLHCLKLKAPAKESKTHSRMHISHDPSSMHVNSIFNIIILEHVVIFFHRNLWIMLGMF